MMKDGKVSSVNSSSKLTYRQRLALQVGRAVVSPIGENKDSNGASFPYGFERYASVAAKCIGRKLVGGFDSESNWY